MIPAALALYFVLRDREPAYAVLGLVALLLGSLLALIPSATTATMGWELGQTYATGSPADKAAALLIMESVGGWSHMMALVMGMILVALGVGLFGLAMLTSQTFPRWLAWLGIVGGGLGLISQLSWFTAALLVVVFVSWLVQLGWTFIAGIYLLRVRPTQT